VVALLDDARDIVLSRVEAMSPGWAEARGWQAYLLGISEADLERADTEGIAAWFLGDPACPTSLRQLAERTAEVTSLVPVLPGQPPAVDFPFMNTRKRGQVAAILRVLREVFPAPSEIVDVGAGRGQLTTQASSALSVTAIGLERDPERVAVATALARDLPVRFVTADVLSPTENPLLSMPPDPRRLLMALHGCGELADALVTAAVATRAAVLLLACCPQKIRGQQRMALMPGGPTWPREILGLANVMARTQGIEGDLKQALATKKSRLALRYMLAARGTTIPAGEEMRGVNRRKANAGFAVFAQAVCQVRGFPAHPRLTRSPPPMSKPTHTTWPSDGYPCPDPCWGDRWRSSWRSTVPCICNTMATTPASLNSSPPPTAPATSPSSAAARSRAGRHNLFGRQAGCGARPLRRSSSQYRRVFLLLAPCGRASSLGRARSQVMTAGSRLVDWRPLRAYGQVSAPLFW
jgi:hypothetical protein